MVSQCEEPISENQQLLFCSQTNQFFTHNPDGTLTQLQVVQTEKKKMPVGAQTHTFGNFKDSQQFDIPKQDFECTNIHLPSTSSFVQKVDSTTMFRTKTPKKKVYKKSIDRIVESTFKRKRKSMSMLPKKRVISPFERRRESTIPRRSKKASYKAQVNSINRLYKIRSLTPGIGQLRSSEGRTVKRCSRSICCTNKKSKNCGNGVCL